MTMEMTLKPKATLPTDSIRQTNMQSVNLLKFLRVFNVSPGIAYVVVIRSNVFLDECTNNISLFVFVVCRICDAN